MDFEELTVKQLRQAARHFDPATRGAGGLGHVGSKDQLIDLLRQKGVMACEVKEVCDGNESLRAPLELDDSLQLGGGQAAGQEQDANNEKDGGQSGQEESGKQQQQPIPKLDDQRREEPDKLEIIRKIITEGLKPDGVDEKAVGAIVDGKLNEFRKQLRKDTVKVIEVKQPDGLPNKVVGVCHHLTEQIAQVCNLGIHQMLVGPAGGGKTTTGEKVAEILDLKFYPMSVGPQTTKSDLLGFIDAAGNYHTTPLREAFEHGGLLLLDEVDAANAGVLTIINALLANGYCSFPDGVKQRSENFRCICACNTYGRGADRQYVGRNQLDAATLDRFAVVDFDYDNELERMIAGNDAWVAKVQKYRERAFKLQMRVVISPRASIFGARLLASGMKESLVEDLVVWKGVSAEIKSKIIG